MKKRAIVFAAITVLILTTAIICVLLASKQPTQIVTDGSQDQGLTFKISEVSPSGATVKYVQKNGDIKGELVITSFGIYLQEDYKYVLEINKMALLRDIPLQLDGGGTFEIDWTEAYDKLNPGEYYLQLSVYDETGDIMEQIYDHESYYIPFTLP